MNREEEANARPPSETAAGDASPKGGGIIRAEWSGPIPPPEVLREFNELVAGGAERIFAQFEAEAAHRREAERKELDFSIRDARIGQMLAAIYAIGAFGLTAYAIHEHAYWVAAMLGGGTIVSGILAFLRKKA